MRGGGDFLLKIPGVGEGLGGFAGHLGGFNLFFGSEIPKKPRNINIFVRAPGREDREIAYVPKVYVPLLAPRSAEAPANPKTPKIIKMTQK